MLGLSVCLAVILAAAFCAAPGFAAESAPLSGVLKFFEISETGDYRALTRAQAEDGAFGTLCAMLPVNSDEEAVLTAAVYNSQGCLQRFETDQKKANAPFQTLSVQIDVGQDETVRFFTFSSLERMTPVSCAAETRFLLYMRTITALSSPGRKPPGRKNIGFAVTARSLGKVTAPAFVIIICKPESRIPTPSRRSLTALRGTAAR